MSETSAVPPTRADTAARWRELIDGRVTREEVHAWTVRWVEGEGSCPDLMVEAALQHLHGFDLRWDPVRPNVVWHGTEGRAEWLHSAEHIAAEFTRWRERCAAYDADPEAWTRGVRGRGAEPAS